MLEKRETDSLEGGTLADWIVGCFVEFGSEDWKSDEKLKSAEKLKTDSLEGAQHAG